jgi:hypothetical protein
LISADSVLFAFSLLGLFLVPAALGRAVWGIAAAFAALGLFLLYAPSAFHPHFNPWTALLLSQAPWILLVLDLLGRGKISLLLGPVPVRALLAFSFFRFMGLRYVLSAVTGALPAEFAVGAAAGEFFAALGALILWATYRPLTSLWYRGALVFWNTYALLTSLGLNFRVLRADPRLDFPGALPSRELHAYFTGWPNALDAFFWIPLAIGVHAAIFYKIFQEGRSAPLPPSRAL